MKNYEDIAKTLIKGILLEELEETEGVVVSIGFYRRAAHRIMDIIKSGYKPKEVAQ